MTKAFFTAIRLVCAFAAAAEVAIVVDGRPQVQVIAPATDAERFAAEEITRYVRQMSGAELKIQQGEPSRAAIRLISSAADGIDDACSVSIDKEDIVITGSNPRATLIAAYRFLDALGCRFLAPRYEHYRGSAEVIPRKATLTFSGEINSAADMRYRKLYVEEGRSHDEANLRQMIEWMPKVGYNVLVVPLDYQGRGRVRWDNWREALTPELQKRGIIIEVGGHGYQNFLNAEMEARDGSPLFTKHPEYFGADGQGRRRKEHGRAPCTSNRDAVAYLTKNLLAYVKDRPEIAIFDLWPPDGVSWCQCEPCAKLGTPSDRQALLLNEVRQRLKEVRPDLKLEGIAYHKLMDAPQKVKLDPSVLIDFCTSRQNFEFTVNDPAAPTMAEGNGYPNGELAAKLQAWRAVFEGDISVYAYYRRYAWDSLPLVLPWFMQAELQFFKSLPVQGISTYCEPGDWFAYELNHYVLANLAWDVEQEVDALVRKFCEARYGNAAPQANAALNVMADVVRKYCSVPYVSLKAADETEAARARLAQAADELARAKPSADEVQQRNIDRLLLAMEYALRDLSIQAMRGRGASEDDIRRAATTLHAYLTDHADQGVFMVKDNRLALPRLLAHYAINEGKKQPQTD